MKKFLAALLTCILLILPVNSYAVQAPLDIKGKSVYLSDDPNITLVSFLAFLRVRTGFTSANTSMVLKNENNEESVKFLMGIPIQLDSISKVRDLSVIDNNKSIKYYQRNTLNNPPNGKSTNVKTWYVWEVSLNPGESKVVECAFSIDNKSDPNGTKSMSFPLDLLENWTGSIKNVQIIADLDFYPAYTFEPNPSIIPIEYDRDGRLTWKFSNVDTFTGNLELFFKPIDVVISNYLEGKFPSNEPLKNILQLFKSKNYHETIKQIEGTLASNTDSEIASISSELKFISTLCYQELYQLDKALEQLNELEDNPGFGETLSNTIRNKIIYDKTHILKGAPGGEEKALEYLNTVKSTIKNNEVFLLWVNDEIRRLTPLPPAQLEENEEEPVQDIQESPSSEKPEVKIISSVDLLGYEVPIEILIGASLLLIIILLLVIRSKKRKRRSRYNSIFR